MISAYVEVRILKKRESFSARTAYNTVTQPKQTHHQQRSKNVMLVSAAYLLHAQSICELAGCS
jgi:hypothetical protein